MSDAYTGVVVSQQRSNSAQGRVKRAGKVCGMSWFPGTARTGTPRAFSSAAAALVLRARALMGQIAARDDQFRGHALDERRPVLDAADRSSRAPTWRSLTCRMRADTGEAGYTVSEMADEQSIEIFDDLYLGLRAGGALRKQRRGEPLTDEEREALGHWQRLSTWRKGIAIGGFAVGTFGLGFTLGGLVFGRWRKAA